jgi:hypothetical protein
MNWIDIFVVVLTARIPQKKLYSFEFWDGEW